MARSFVEERWEGFKCETLDDLEDEALSLCDLPVKLSKEDNDFKYEKPRAIETEDEFDFGSLNGSDFTQKPQMCLADEVFFKGQIVPVRHSISSENSSIHHNFSRSGSRSESMDHGSLGKFRSINSSRSSSSGSHFSSSSNNSIIRPKIPNLFHSHPSPKPQIRISTSRQGSSGGRNQKSSTWDFFRLGPVRTPGMELQDLKNRSNNGTNNNNSNSNNRNSVSRNNSSRSSNNIRALVGNNGGNSSNENQTRPRVSMEKRGGLGILSGVSCRFSVETMNQVPKIMIKSSSNSNSNTKIRSSTRKSNNHEREAAHAIREKVLMELKMKKQKQMIQKQMKQEGKQALSRHRTFEWLKELSHATFLDHDS